MTTLRSPLVISTDSNFFQLGVMKFKSDVYSFLRLNMIHKINVILIDQKIYTAYTDSFTMNDYTQERYNQIVSNFCNNLK